MKPDETGEALSQAAPPSPILFLDTNGIHYARLAAAIAKKSGFIISQSGLELFKQAANNYGAYPTAMQNIESGYWICRYLAKRFREDDARVLYAPVSGIELRQNGLRGRAAQNAANCGVPYRWYRNPSERELLHHLGQRDFEEVQSECTGIDDLFQEQAGVGVRESAESELFRAFELSQIILGAVLLDLGDSLVYASALLSRA